MDPETIAARQAKEKEAAAEKLAGDRHKQSLAKIDALANSNLEIMRSFVAYLNKRTAKVEVSNQLKKIATPDALKVVAIIEKLDKTVKDKKIDWKPMQEALKPIAEALSLQASKKDPDPLDLSPLEIDYQKIADSFGAAIDKLAAPVVNLPAPVVKIQKAAPTIVNTEKVDMKPFVNEVLQVLTDFRVWTQDQIEPDPVPWTEFKEILEKQNTFWEKLLKKNFGGGGASGGGGYIFKQAGVTGRPLVAPDAIASTVDPTIVGIVAVNADGTPIGGSGTDVSLLATKANQTNGTQKSQITDGTDNLPIGSDTDSTGVATASGDTVILAVAGGFKVQVYHVSFVPTTSSAVDRDVAVKIGSRTILGWRTNKNGGGFARSKKNGQGWWEGADGEDVVINLSGADSIRWNLDYDIVPA